MKEAWLRGVENISLLDAHRHRASFVSTRDTCGAASLSVRLFVTGAIYVRRFRDES